MSAGFGIAIPESWLWWWFFFTQLCGIAILCICACCFMQCTCCRLPRCTRRLLVALRALSLRYLRPASADGCTQVEIHDLDGLTVPGLKYLLRRFEMSTAGTRDVLVSRITGAFEGRGRVWPWYIGIDAAHPPQP